MKQSQLIILRDKLRSLTAILNPGLAGHGQLREVMNCCGRCKHFRQDPVAAGDIGWYGFCRLRKKRSYYKHYHPKEAIPYNRYVCQDYEENTLAQQCWEVIPKRR